MFCHKCGNECADDAAFCTNCGEYVRDTETAKNPVIEISKEVSRSLELEAEKQPQITENPTVEVYNITLPKAKSKLNVKRLVIICSLCVLLLLAVAVGIFIVFNDNPKETENTQSDYVSSEVLSEESFVSTEPAPDKMSSKYLVGDWTFEIPASSMIAIGEDTLSGFSTNAKLGMTMRFSEDKTVAVLCKVEDYKKTYHAMAEDYAEYLKNGGIYELYAVSSGYTKEQVDNMMAEYNMTPELIAQNIKVSLEEDINSEKVLQGKTVVDGYIVVTDTEKITKYSLGSNTITFVTDKDVSRETYFDFDFKNGTMTVTEGDYAEGLLNGVCLTKQY